MLAWTQVTDLALVIVKPHAALGSNILGHCAAHHIQTIGNQTGDLPLPDEMYWIASWSARMVQETSPWDWHWQRHLPLQHWLALTAQSCSLLDDYSIPETSNTDLSLKQFTNIRTGPQELCWDAETALSLTQRGRLEQWWGKHETPLQTHPGSAGLPQSALG